MDKHNSSRFQHQKAKSELDIEQITMQCIHVLVIILIISIISFVVVLRDNVNVIYDYSQQYVSRNLLSQIFSTIIESLVALIALLGMVAIYRIQRIRRSIETVAGAMREHLIAYRKTSVSYPNKNGGFVTFSSSEVYGYTVEKIIKDIKGLAKTYSDDIVLQRANLELFNLEKNLSSIEKAAKPFFSSVILLVIFSLVLLPLSPILEYSLFALLFLWLIIFWSSASFVLGLNFLIGLL